MFKGKIVFDFHGVLANMWELKNWWAQALYGVTLPPEYCFSRQIIGAGVLTREQYEDLQYLVYYNPQTREQLRPTPGASEFLKLAKRHGYVAQEVVTSSRDCPNGPADHARASLQAWFPEDPLVVASPNQGPYQSKYERGSGKPKSTVLVPGEQIVFEDDPKNIPDLLTVPGVTVFLLDWPYNRNVDLPEGAIRVYSFMHALGYLSERAAA
ncbi:MAG: hypothetical protein ABI747_04040 [Candidatus Moraniibacteriota bacterium]